MVRFGSGGLVGCGGRIQEGVRWWAEIFENSLESDDVLTLAEISARVRSMIGS